MEVMEALAPVVPLLDLGIQLRRNKLFLKLLSSVVETVIDRAIQIVSLRAAALCCEHPAEYIPQSDWMCRDSSHESTDRITIKCEVEIVFRKDHLPDSVVKSREIGCLIALSSSDILSGETAQVPIKCAPQPCDRHFRIFTDIVPGHFINEPANVIDFLRRFQGPTGIRKLPEMCIADVYFDVRIIGGDKFRKADRFCNRYGTKTFCAQCFLRQFHIEPEKIIKRNQSAQGIPEIGDTPMSLVHRFENVVTIMAGIIVVAAEMRILSPQSFMPNLIVFDNRTLFV